MTGAGISVASGIKSYRGPGGIFENADSCEYPTVETLDNNPFLIWRRYGAMRHEISQAEPNIAHFTLAKIKEQLDDNKNFTLITQNTDGLHRKSGSKNVVELHGNIFKTRCRNKKCTLTPFHDLKTLIMTNSLVALNADLFCDLISCCLTKVFLLKKNGCQKRH
ncbi:MAG: Sir2 family NAD-dependent protein deacetylase [Candidatus Electrothrix sp. YB6]